MKIQTFLILLICISHSAFPQKYTISGYVEDAASGEKLFMANIYDLNSMAGTASNVYGFYSLTLPAGKIKLTYSYIGYTTITKEFDLSKNLTLNISLEPAIQLKEVTVDADKIEAIVKRSQMSAIEIPLQKIKTLPVLLGETDIIKTVQLLPGVQSGNEGSSGLYVRGGGPDQNLILLDGVPVYNVNHLFGFFSVFNADAVNSVTLIKGGFPARYGGRLSSVLDIRMKEGNMKEIKGEGSVGIVASRLTIEGPILKDKASFIISGRRTYIDILAQPFIKYFSAKQQGYDKFMAGYFFYDLNSKLNYKFSDRNRLYLSAYLGNDKAYMRMQDSNDDYFNKTNFNLRWGNITSAFRWNYILNNKLFSNTTITYSRYRFSTGGYFTNVDKIQNTTEEMSYDYISGIYDWGGKADFDYMPAPNHYIRFGINNIYHTFKPGINVFKQSGAGSGIDTTFGNKNIYANEYSVYAEDDMKLFGRLNLNAGLHYSGFLVENEFYHSLQPRLSGSYILTEKWSVKAAYSHMSQYIHLLTNTSIGLPTDLWLPVTDTIKPMKSVQYALGSAYSVSDQIVVTLEGFYKSMENLIEYKEGASFFSSKDNWEQNVEMGRGWSYGVELLIEKKFGKISGWLGYTLSWSQRQFENISFGQVFPYKYDSRHDISIAVTYKITDNIDAGAVWVYSTGTAVTLAMEKYLSSISYRDEFIYNYYDNNFIEYFEKRNSYRMPSYHRLDLSVNFHKKLKWGERILCVGVYNAYNRKNPFFLRFEPRDDETVLVQYSLFPIIPSISYNFKF
ncbi:MAG: TonB-dependent receptor [Bacteroidia bacterium]|nr:TonB-dependent receptor [Bacteroidia bacterium]